jgi:uncharacterized protein (DUF427 family)
VKALWKNTTLADSDKTIVVEGNHYFPADSIAPQYFVPSDTHTSCAWKGIASYYTIKVDGEVNKDAAWYYPDPEDAASNIKGRIAFWKGISVA